MNFQKLFSTTIITTIAILSFAVAPVNAQTAGDVCTVSNLLPVASMNSSTSRSYKKSWKATKKQQFVKTAGYINRPYHNPDLVQQKREQRRQAALRKQQEQARKLKEKNEVLKNMCYFAMMSNRNRNYVQGGPQMVMSRQVFPRTVMNYSDYKNVCIPLRRKIRDDYRQSRNSSF